MCHGPTADVHTNRYQQTLREQATTNTMLGLPQVQPKPQYRPARRANPLRLVPPDDLGYCSVCGANFAEYLECKEGDCNWVRDAPG